ncbi:energy-coupling factor ABC transporter ATP-binding protein [Fervidobacterium thailandense]|uniref:Cobalt ABC transporter ATP-binding protein n=1 Tax=Fervidobacterium thailandense TaxID=1008305 RepID=A0A1E3G487_9BACT|nr:ABC transporter ATP-binding protein [Fervidobacterium thailandense]ODN30930.1 cobalt ABC transporter ATP-binding protein [Fervidobacterium thailandense]
MEPVVKVENLWFSYKPGKFVLENINLSLNASSTAIVGQNGAGKTTFVKILKGLLKPTVGDVWVKGVNTKQKTVAQLAKVVGLVFQDPSDQIFKSKVIDEVMFGPLNIFKDKQYSYERAIEALKLVGLEGKVNDHPYDLTLSERKLLCIASVLAMDPEVIIFDEPTIAQDRYHVKRIGELVLELEKNGKTIIAITHDMDFVFEYFKRTLVLHRGKLLADGKTEEVLKQEDILKTAGLEMPYIFKISSLVGKDLSKLLER